MRIKIPSKYKDITLRQLQVLTSTEDTMQHLSALCGLSTDELRKMPVAQLNAANKEMNRVVSAETTKFKQHLEIDGVEYGFIPDFSEMTIGEYTDIEEMCMDFWANAHKVMAVLYRPIVARVGKKYRIEEYTAREDSEPFLRMSAESVSGALLFFWTTRERLLNTMRSTLLTTAQEAMSSPLSGGGITYSSSWRAKMSRVWKRLRGLPLDT